MKKALLAACFAVAFAGPALAQDAKQVKTDSNQAANSNINCKLNSSVYAKLSRNISLDEAIKIVGFPGKFVGTKNIYQKIYEWQEGTENCKGTISAVIGDGLLWEKHQSNIPPSLDIALLRKNNLEIIMNSRSEIFVRNDGRLFLLKTSDDVAGICFLSNAENQVDRANLIAGMFVDVNFRAEDPLLEFWYGDPDNITDTAGTSSSFTKINELVQAVPDNNCGFVMGTASELKSILENPDATSASQSAQVLAAVLGEEDVKRYQAAGKILNDQAAEANNFRSRPKNEQYEIYIKLGLEFERVTGNFYEPADCTKAYLDYRKTARDQPWRDLTSFHRGVANICNAMAWQKCRIQILPWEKTNQLPVELRAAPDVCRKLGELPPLE